METVSVCTLHQAAVASEPYVCIMLPCPRPALIDVYVVAVDKVARLRVEGRAAAAAACVHLPVVRM
jgi:hypothetical protein